MIKGKLTIEKRDMGLNKFRERNAKLAAKGAHVTVGVHGDAEAQYEGISVVEIATIHEFGLGQHQRSFVRAWVDEKKNEIDNAINVQAKKISLGQLDQETALAQLGSLFVASMQKRMSDGIPPPNAESTKARKGSSTPLIDTEQLRASIDFKVEQ